MFEKAVFLTHLAATLVMVGVIWIVQIVHYPLFGNVGAEGFAVYETEHSRRITFVVAPLMLAELATAVLLVWSRPAGVTALQAWIGVALVAVVWASTFFVQVPLHGKLGGGFDADAHARLVLTNWVRTAAWSLRGALVVWMVSSRI